MVEAKPLLFDALNSNLAVITGELLRSQTRNYQCADLRRCISKWRYEYLQHRTSWSIRRISDFASGKPQRPPQKILSSSSSNRDSEDRLLNEKVSHARQNCIHRHRSQHEM